MTSTYMAELLMSPVKRENLRKQKKAEQKKEMRASLPVYTREQVRRYRLPLHEAIFKELEEQNMPSSAAFLKQLVDYQEWMRKTNGPESRIWARPRVVERNDVLNALSEGFKHAEMAHYNNDFAGEIDQFLHLSEEYAFGKDDWWWLGEQLMVQCNRLAKTYEGDGRRRYAIAEYMFGKFLYENLGDRDQAVDHLNHARRLSMGHSWTAGKYLHCIQKTVFVECCIVLYKVHLDEAKEIMVCDAKAAIKLCIKAKRRAYDACVHEGEAKAMLLQGNCHMLIDEINEAAQCFYKVLSMQMKAKKIEETCEARIWLLRAYLKLGHWEESYAHLQKLLDFALENNLPYYIGQSYRYLGEYYLNHGNPNLATPLLLKAIGAFHEIGDVNNREQVKNFAAVSAGQELMPKYIRYIMRSGEKSPDTWKYLQKILEWKDSRKIVWTESDTSVVPRMSFEEALMQAGESGCELMSFMESAEEEQLAESSKEESSYGTGTGTKEFSVEGAARVQGTDDVNVKVDAERTEEATTPSTNVSTREGETPKEHTEVKIEGEPGAAKTDDDVQEIKTDDEPPEMKPEQELQEVHEEIAEKFDEEDVGEEDDKIEEHIDPFEPQPEDQNE